MKSSADSTQIKRLLFVWADVAGLGGTERRMIEATRTLSQLGVEVHSFMISATARRPLQEILQEAGAKSLGHGGLGALFTFWRRASPDAVIAFGMRPSLSTRLLRAVGRLDSPLFMAQNGLDFKSTRSKRLLDRLTRGLLDAYVANSVSAGDLLLERGVRPDRVIVVPSGIDERWAAPRPTRNSFRRVAMIGNSRPEKNQKFGIEVFLKATEPDILTVFTDDPKPLNSLLATRSDNPRVAQVVLVENEAVEPSTLDEVDVLLHPSLSESLPRAVLEALARGCWVIASDVGDLPAIIPPGTGEVISGYDINSYVEALDQAARMNPSDVRPVKVRTTQAYVEDLLDSLVPFAGQRAHAPD